MAGQKTMKGPRLAQRTILGVLVVVAAGCTGVADEGKLPPDVQDPATLQTPAGAVARYRGAIDSLPSALDWYVARTAILTDELADLPTPLNVGGFYGAINLRLLNPAGTDFEGDYNRLHRLRAQAREARGFLQAYAPAASPALTGHLYAVEGYADVLLADLFCSGIPLSTVDFKGDYTFQPGSSTHDVYERAVGLFDSALALLSDSARLQPMAALGRGRALLALGRYTDAAVAVVGVDDGYQYQASFTYDPNSPALGQSRLLFSFLAGNPSEHFTQRGGAPSMGNLEGGNGLNYLSAGTAADPRVLADALGEDLYHHTLWLPRKAAAAFPLSGNVPLVLADGIEARLIEAEAALQGHDVDGWLLKLNVLRATVGLADTNDPGATLAEPAADSARVDLLFRERAFWLYFTGHRQGDLRRLIRQYQRHGNDVYPSGGGYGTSVVAPLPETEQQRNPKYTGCINFDA